MNDDTASGQNEYDLKIAILESALELISKHPSAAEDPRADERRWVLTTVRLLQRAFGIGGDASPPAITAAAPGTPLRSPNATPPGSRP